MKNYLVLLIAMCICPLVAAQQPLDSLYAMVARYDPSQQPDTNYVNALNTIAATLHHHKPEQSLYFAQKAIEASDKIYYLKGKAYALREQGIALFAKANQRKVIYNKALESYLKSLRLAEYLKDQRGIAYCWNQIGLLYLSQNNPTKAAEYCRKSLDLSTSLKDASGKARALNALGRIALHQKDQDAAEEYAIQALDEAQAARDFESIKEASALLYDRAKRRSNAAQALQYLEAYQMSSDSLFLYEKNSLIVYAEAERKEKESIIKKQKALSKENEELQSQDAEQQRALRNNIEQQSSYERKLAAELEKKEKQIQALAKAQAYLKRDKELQRIEAERQKNARLVLQKQADAQRLLTMAQQEKDKRKQDSLNRLANQMQAEVTHYLGQEQKLQAESKARALEVLKEKEAKEFQQMLNYIVLAGLLAVAGLAYFIFRGKQREQRAKEEIAEQKEEIEQVNEELNATLSIVEAERQKSDKLLLNILPLETAQELKETGIARPKRYELITVLFTDFKGFTNIAEKLTPEQVIAELDYCFLAFDEICEKYNLEKIKTIGDAYMCAGGLPIPNTTNPVDVVRAGLEMQAWMVNWKAQKEARGERVWELRLGIHSGEAVAGVIGKNKFAYDIWGDTVNTASRMESAGEVGKVNISGATYSLVKDTFRCTYRGAVKAKNKGDIEMYFVEGLL